MFRFDREANSEKKSNGQTANVSSSLYNFNENPKCQQLFSVRHKNNSASLIAIILAASRNRKTQKLLPSRRNSSKIEISHSFPLHRPMEQCLLRALEKTSGKRNRTRIVSKIIKQKLHVTISIL